MAASVVEPKTNGPDSGPDPGVLTAGSSADDGGTEELERGPGVFNIITSVLDTGARGWGRGPEPGVLTTCVLAGGAGTEGVDGIFDVGVDERFVMGVASVEASLDPENGEKSDGAELGVENDLDVERLGRSWYRPDPRGLFSAGGPLPSMVSRNGYFEGNGCGEDTLCDNAWYSMTVEWNKSRGNEWTREFICSSCTCSRVGCCRGGRSNDES